MIEPPFFEDMVDAFKAFRQNVHVPQDVMLEFAAGKLNEETSAVVRAHLTQCDACKELEEDARIFTQYSRADLELSQETMALTNRSVARVLAEIEGAGASLGVAITHDGRPVDAQHVVVEEEGRRYRFGPLPGPGEYSIDALVSEITFSLSESDLTIPLARGGPAPESADVKSFSSADGRMRVRVRSKPNSAEGGKTEFFVVLEIDP